MAKREIVRRIDELTKRLKPVDGLPLFFVHFVPSPAAADQTHTYMRSDPKTGKLRDCDAKGKWVSEHAQP